MNITKILRKLYLASDLKYKFNLKILKYFSLTIVFVFCFSSCKKDDDGSVDSIPANDYTEQHIIENDSIIDFMQNHFYNYEDFLNLQPGDGPELIIDSIKGDNIDKISIFDQVSSLEINIKDSDGNLFPHTSYYVILREGIGDNPTVADSVFVKYKGMLLNKDVFDQRNTPIWLQAKNLVRGFQEFVPLLKKGNIDINSDGTYNFSNFGIGFVIMPSGLGYYNGGTANIPQYSPLIFQVQMMTLNKTDHDNDTVLTILEDLDGDSNFDNDDTDSDTIPNYQDPDDDNDGVLTKDEYDVDGDGVADDTDGDGIPDYLDNE